MAPKARIGSMRKQVRHGVSAPWGFVFALVIFASTNTGIAKTPRTLAPPIRPAPAGIKQIGRQDDSFNLKPPPDLALRPENERKAGALAHFIEGMAFEENGEMDQALEAYRKVLNVDPGQSGLASRVAALLIQQEDFPQAIDILKDAIKANPNDAEPYRQLAFIYAKYLKKTDQAVDYANRAIALNPRDIEAYQRLVEIEFAVGEKKRRSTFWIVPQKFGAMTRVFGRDSGNCTQPFFSNLNHCRNRMN